MISKRLNPKDVRTHPALGIFSIDPDVLERITAHMRQYGYDSAHPIVLGIGPWTEEGPVVVDGHTRLRASLDASIEEVDVTISQFETLNQAVEWAIHYQRDRRNLSAGELHKLIQAIDRPHEHGGDRKSEEIKGTRDPLKSDQVEPVPLEKTSLTATAKTVGVSPKTVQHSRLIASDPEIEEKVQTGEITSLKEGAKQVQKRRAQALPVNVRLDADGKRTDVIGNHIRVSSDTSHKKIRRIVEQGTPELVTALDRGEISIRQGMILVKQPEKVQREILRKDAKERAKAIKELQYSANCPSAELLKLTGTTIRDTTGYTSAHQFATIAISHLEQITIDDPKLKSALLRVRKWIDDRLQMLQGNKPNRR
jgi:ParB-like chromosome segregation protein Spo0J